MDALLARNFMTRMWVENRVQRAVQISVRVVGGRGGWDTWGEGVD